MDNEMQPIRLSVSTPAEVLGVIPIVLGFHPAESLVLLVVEGNTVKVTARGDLADSLVPGGVDAQFGRLWPRFACTHVVAVAYTDDPGDAWAALSAVVEALPSAIQIHLVHAGADAFWTAPDDDPQPYDPRATVAAARATFAGLPVLASRDELEAGLEPRYEPLELAEAAGAAQRLSVAEAVDRAGDLLVSGPLDATAAAVIVRACEDRDFVEGITWAICSANARACLDTWRLIASGVDPTLSGPALGVLAVASWVAGNGALATMCLERALRLDYWDSGLDMIDMIIGGAVSPRAWDDLRAAYLEQVGCGRDAVRSVR